MQAGPPGTVLLEYLVKGLRKVCSSPKAQAVPFPSLCTRSCPRQVDLSALLQEALAAARAGLRAAAAQDEKDDAAERGDGEPRSSATLGEREASPAAVDDAAVDVDVQDVDEASPACCAPEEEDDDEEEEPCMYAAAVTDHDHCALCARHVEHQCPLELHGRLHGGRSQELELS